MRRLGVLATIEPYIGKYYSTEWVRRKVLRQTDAEMIEMDEQIEQEIKDGIIPDPSSSRSNYWRTIASGR